MKNFCRLIAVLFFLVAFQQFSSTAAFAQQKETPRPFLIGADWNDNDSPEAKSLFYECGCNFVRLAGGGYGWSLDDHKKSLMEFHQHGVYIMLQMGSHWPDGSYVNYPEDLLIDDQGKSGVIDKSQGLVSYDGSDWPQYTYASPEFRVRLEKDFTTYLKEIGTDPNVVQAQLHNEPGYHWLNGRVFDYNPKAISAFKLWLPTQYSDIAALNASWGTKFTSFGDVEPVKQRPPVSNIAAWMDWRRFNIDLIAKFLAWEQGFVHSVLPNLPSLTNMSGPLDNWFPIRLGDNYKFTAPFDSAGIDIYATEWTNKYNIGYSMDMTRGAAESRPITVCECEPYPASKFTGLTDEQLGDRLRSDLWRYIGHGAKSISLWTLYDLANSGYGERITAVREIAHLSKMLNLADYNSPHRKVALVADQDAFLYYGGIDSGLDGGMRCQDSLEGLYQALVTSGLDVDIISTDQVRSGLGSQYRALVMASPAISDARLQLSLAAFLNHGGLVIAEAPLGEFNRWGAPIPASENGFDKLFSVTAVHPYNDGDDSAISSIDLHGKGKTVVQLNGAVALATFADGSPAVTQASVGAGKAIFIASDVGLRNLDGAQTGLVQFLSSTIAKDAGVKPLVEAKSDGYLDTSLLADARGNELITVENTTDKLDPPVTRNNVELVVHDQTEPAGSQLFIITPTRSVAGRTSAGPLLSTLPRPIAGSIHIPLEPVDSATVCLIMHEHTPLLAISGPSSATVGTSEHITVICYNPSPRLVSGTITLSAPSGWLGPVKGTPVQLPARGEKNIDFAVQISGPAGRAVVKAAFQPKSGAEIISSPIDVMVRGS